jgi:hypothetical protein
VVPRWAGQIPGSDKTLHFVAYLLLSFLLWLAINPNRKINWRKPAVWWILLVVVWYGVIDEWLQTYVGRNADIYDFFANLAGALTGLIILTFVNFWPASLVITGSGIFVMTNFFRARPVTPGLQIDFLIYAMVYVFFTLLWLRYIYNFLPVESPQGRWLFGAIALPVGLMVGTEVFCIAAGHGFSLLWPSLAIAANIAVVLPVYIYGFITAKRELPVSEPANAG